MKSSQALIKRNNCKLNYMLPGNVSNLTTLEHDDGPAK